MQFDLRTLAIVTISPLDPTVLFSLAAASIGAWFLGRALGTLTKSVMDPWRRRLYMGPVWLLAALVFFILPNILVSILFPMAHPDYRQATVCVAMVWPTFFIPAFVGLLAARRALRRAILATTAEAR